MLTIPKEKLPIHIACIMDGNGRWANSICRGRQATGRERIRWSAVRTSA
jgi:undecaprenyl diphosphate synthase